MNAIELKVPPPLVALFAGLVMWLASRVVAPFEASTPLRTAAGIAFGIVGFSFVVAGFFSFRQARTTINPTKPMATSSLVTAGVYRHTRNPMYLGLLFVLLGWAAYLGNPAAFLFLPLFVLYINRFQIAPEERALSLLFGEEFAAYKVQVRRWI